MIDGSAGKLAVVAEVQTAPDNDKRWVWPSYLLQARLHHRCPAVLLVICRDLATGRWARQPAAGLERDRLGTFTQLIRASASLAARKALEAMMATVFKDDFLERFFAEGEAAGQASGMAKGLAEGRAEGEASMLLRMLSALGFDVPAQIRARVLGCTDLEQLGTWADRAAGAATLDEIFAS